MKTNKGFSLVELIVVIAIMAIVSAVAIPVYQSYLTKAEDAVQLQSVSELAYAVELANAEYFTQSAAVLANDKTAITVTFYGANGAKAAEQVGEIMSANYTDSSVTFTFENSLGDVAVAEVGDILAPLNTYNNVNQAPSSSPVPAVPTLDVLAEAINELLAKYPDEEIVITVEDYETTPVSQVVIAVNLSYGTGTISDIDLTNELMSRFDVAFSVSNQFVMELAAPVGSKLEFRLINQ